MGSDLAISSTITAPVSGCNLSNSELVTITILNADNSAYSGTFSVSFSSASTTVTETITIPVLNTSATYIYTFTGTIDLSACGIHSIILSVNDMNDVNSSNDSITVAVTNDCTPTFGNFSGPMTVCESGNTGQITLNGNSGIISGWAYSEDGGTTLINTGNTTNIQPYANISVDRFYRVYYDSQFGICPSDSIDYAITVDAESMAGMLTADSTHCDTILPTTLFLNGYNGVVVNYQLSLNGGISYTTFTNPFDTLQYIEFSNNFQFFAITENGSCPTDSSNIVAIDIITPAMAGTITGEDTLCFGDSTVDLDLIGFDGNIVDWQYTFDSGAMWTSAGLSSSNVSLSGISASAQIRVIVEKPTCGSDTAFYNITVLPASEAGFLQGGTVFCETTNSGFAYTTGIVGDIIGWVYLEAGGGNLLPISNTNDTLFYTNLSTTTSYAIIVQDGNCEPDTSNYITIQINEGSDAGIIESMDSICPSPDGAELLLINYLGDILAWEYSIDNGANWVNTTVTDSLQYINDIFGLVYIRAVVQNGTCMADTSFKSIYILGPLSSFELEDSLQLGDSIQLFANGGVSFEWTPNIYINNNLISDPKVSPPINTVYELTVTDSNGCVSNSSHRIVVIDNPNILTINNLITPNGDGFNDTWLIENIELFPNNSVHVFNSYGQIIYEAAPYQNDWDVASLELPDGTYFYMIVTKPSATPIKGAITIISSK